MKKIIHLFILIFIMLKLSVAQISYNIKFEHLSIADGLSQSSVFDIVQDFRGFMWFATLDGLNRYDGYNIKVYYNYQTSGLSDNIITCLYQTPDTAHQLWVGTQTGGINLYNRINDKFITFSKQIYNLPSNFITDITGNYSILWIATDNGLVKFQQKKQKFSTINLALPSKHITKIIQTSDGNLWIGTKKGLAYYDTSLNKVTFYDTNNLNKLPANNITALKKDIYGNLWIGTSNGLAYFELSNKKISVFTTKDGLTDNFITDILIDFQGIIWITTRKGLNRLDPVSNNIITFYHNPTNLHSLSVNNLISIYEDDAHIIWIGTSLGGVNIWNRAVEELLLFRHNPYDETSLSSNQVRSFYEDKNGTVWVGTVDGGLNKWNKQKRKFIHFIAKSNCKFCISGNHIRSILEDSYGNFWLATDKHGLNLFDRKTNKVIKKYNKNNSILQTNRIWKIIEDKNHWLWIATYGDGLYRFSPMSNTFYKLPKNISSEFCTSVFEDSKGRIWIATMDGLNLYLPKKNKLQVFKHNKQDSHSISDSRIYIIFEDSKHNIWIGTKGGLNKYLENGSFEYFTATNSDLPNNVILGILEDKNGNIWVSTNRGLAKINPNTKKIKSYDINDGLQSNEFLLGSYYKTKDGMFLFGGINGFNAFYPEKIKQNKHIPAIVITDFMVSNRRIPLDTVITEKKMIVLNHKQRDLTIRFVALDYILPEKNQYAYKLIGYDKQWNYVKNQREAKYTNLPPGNYIFWVKGSNNDGIWNQKGTKLFITIKPAFWQTTIFKVVIALFLILSIFTAFRIRIIVLKRRQKILEQEVQRKTKQIIEQKEEIERQKELAELQRDQIAMQKKDIEDSIRYAQKIQKALLPEKDLLDKLLKDYFIIYKPRDIVSGDFYWLTQKNQKIILVAADCTGHGVPGAFMSMLGISFLSKIVNDWNITDADQILNNLRESIIKALHQRSMYNETHDGMDIALVVIDKQNKKIQFAGANNSMYLIRNGQLSEYKADKMPIGIYEVMELFTKKVIDYQENDQIFLFSDGFADQFGGPKAKKFKYKKLKQLFIQINSMPLNMQKLEIEKVYNRWISYPDPYTGKEKFDQVDDILIVSVKL